ncbi:MAG: accessory Sec system translocase SecA2, partial [Clostridiales bacterium]|nr:accessory Sec system translocase SecA2 [Clostridiales bacterium]
LAAVFVASLRALSRKGVHIMTFNDYLAGRDAQWMGPIFELLGFSVGTVRESSSPADRKAAYQCDITYVTAREAGFDYLRTFLVTDENEIVHRPFHYAIIDEADSIMIDEARVPMVIAGEMSDTVRIRPDLYASVRALQENIHYRTDEYAENIFLTDEGILQLEKDLGIENLFAEDEPDQPDTVDILTQANVIIPALHLLQKNVDYIVRDGQVQLVDTFTGRISKLRQWPDGLQAAVEIKENVPQRTNGMIMNQVTFQHFINLYPGFCGMTGTAVSAAPEFAQFYDIPVTVIPPNRPCIRNDLPDVIFTHREAKYQHLIAEIVRIHSTGRPILVGTCSVEESELIADRLRKEGVLLEVLNARNDEREAQIIADAGRKGAVTISTNMAGRGVDIRLGGPDEAGHEHICALGGLYVIGTNRHESIRIDLQLRGRAGRQGDPGESRFFISLQDPMLVKYRVGDALSRKFRLTPQDDPIRSRAVRSAVAHTQRVVEGQNFDTKTTLAKYSFMPNEQRKLIEKKRMNILFGQDSLSVLEKHDRSLLDQIMSQVSEDEYHRARKQIELFALNRCWADHLVAVQSGLDGVEIVSMLKGDPFLTYNQRLIEAFEQFEDHLDQTVVRLFESLKIDDGVVDLPQTGVDRPTSTRTYLVHDGTEEQAFINDFAMAYLNAPFFLALKIFHHFFGKSEISDA